MSSLTRADIFAAADRPVVKLDVPEWGGTVYFRPLSVAQARIVSDAPDAMSSAMIVALAVCSEDMTPLFTAADAETLAERNAIVVGRVATAIMAQSSPKAIKPGN